MKKYLIPLGIILLAVVGLSFFFFNRQNSTDSNICVSDQEQILALVKTFESDQQAKNASAVLALFTTPSQPADVAAFQHLSGSDDGMEPRLYNSVGTNYSLNSYTMQQPTTGANNSCVVQVKEFRIYSGGPSGPQNASKRSDKFSLVLVQQGGNWKIDEYQSLNPQIQPGKYSGFLMEEKTVQ